MFVVSGINLELFYSCLCNDAALAPANRYVRRHPARWSLLFYPLQPHRLTASTSASSVRGGRVSGGPVALAQVGLGATICAGCLFRDQASRDRKTKKEIKKGSYVSGISHANCLLF